MALNVKIVPTVMLIIMMLLFIIGLPLMTSGGIMRPTKKEDCPESDACKKSRKINWTMVFIGCIMMLGAIGLGVAVIFTSLKKVDIISV